jgi:hypothetical protein
LSAAALAKAEIILLAFLFWLAKREMPFKFQEIMDVENE